MRRSFAIVALLDLDVACMYVWCQIWWHSLGLCSWFIDLQRKMGRAFQDCSKPDICLEGYQRKIDAMCLSGRSLYVFCAVDALSTQSARSEVPGTCACRRKCRAISGRRCSSHSPQSPEHGPSKQKACCLQPLQKRPLVHDVANSPRSRTVPCHFGSPLSEAVQRHSLLAPLFEARMASRLIVVW